MQNEFDCKQHRSRNFLRENEFGQSSVNFSCYWGIDNITKRKRLTLTKGHMNMGLIGPLLFLPFHKGSKY